MGKRRAGGEGTSRNVRQRGDNLECDIHQSGSIDIRENGGAESNSARMRTGARHDAADASSSANVENLQSEQVVRAAISRSTYSTRSSTHMVKEIIDKLTPEQENAIKDLGFAPILKILAFNLDNDYCSWLVDHFNAEQRTLNVHGRSLKVTPKHVGYVTGLNSEGLDVAALESELSLDDNLLTEFNIQLDNGGEIGLARLRTSLMKTNSSGTDFKVKFVLFLLCRLLCPRTKLVIRKSLLAVVAKVDNFKNMNWSKYILDHLIDSLRDQRQRNQFEFVGCIVVLMILYFEHFCIHGDTYTALCNRHIPRVEDWDEEVLKRKVDQLKVMGVFNGAQVDAMFEDHSVGEERRLEDGIEKIESRLQSIEDAMRDLKGQVEQFHQMVTRLVEMMEVNQKMVLQEMRRINAKSSIVCESCGMNGDGLHNFGDCAICLNRMMLQETALVKGCQHAYCVTCILRWASYKEQPTCPLCTRPFEFLITHRSPDGSIRSYMSEESVRHLLEASWFSLPVDEEDLDEISVGS
ncbi:uncharacterized protein LOC113779181 [Coffea eugenioides]|uniref:uncharacterized protein LOC113779181 n=1 Tax=Coffea eugenioides TaxID=49369 RepID=UPI000F604787|nr:uncharacterized protein LOC113779181 [Coffea eugenioides]